MPPPSKTQHSIFYCRLAVSETSCHKRKTEVALQFSGSCTAEAALQHSLFCSADVVFTTSCTATNDKLRCNIEKKTALQESGAFLPLSCGFQAPTFRLPRLGPAEVCTCNEIARFEIAERQRNCNENCQ